MSRVLQVLQLKSVYKLRQIKQPGFVLENYNCKSIDFTSVAWRKHTLNTNFSKFHAKRLLRLLHLLWRPFKCNAKIKIRCVPTRRPHTTISRGVLVRKKQSRNTFNWRSAGWHLHIQQPMYFLPITTKAQLSTSKRWFFKKAFQLNAIDSLVDSNVAPIGVSRFTLSTAWLSQFRVLQCPAFIHICEYFQLFQPT